MARVGDNEFKLLEVIQEIVWGKEKKERILNTQMLRMLALANQVYIQNQRLVRREFSAEGIQNQN